MAQYIDKSALVADIEKAIKSIYAGREYVGIPYDEECIVRGLQKAEDIINTLEVKEVNEVPATVMVNKYGNRFISSWSGLKEYDGLKEGEEIKILIPKK
jgi:hypothetical protein